MSHVSGFTKSEECSRLIATGSLGLSRSAGGIDGEGDISNTSGTLATRPRMWSVEVTRRVARMLGVGGSGTGGIRGAGEHPFTR